MSMDFDQVMEKLKVAMEELDGKQIAEIVNQVCDEKIVYKEDSVWEPEMKEFDVTVKGSVTKTLRIMAPNEECAQEQANQDFNIQIEPGVDEKYEQEVIDTKEVS